MRNTFLHKDWDPERPDYEQWVRPADLQDFEQAFNLLLDLEEADADAGI